MTDFDFDTRNSDLQVGIEVEYPIYDPAEHEWLVSRGKDSNNLRHEMRAAPESGAIHYDATVGTEFVSPVLDLRDMDAWYAGTLIGVEERTGAEYNPVGLMAGGNTAGTHIHISDLSRSQARELYEISQTTWAKVLFCSSIASDSDDSITWPVFRGGRYCQMEFGPDHYNVVNNVNGGHYEWRLPEPMVPEHMEIVKRFLALFEREPEQAREYAQELLNDGDGRITSIKRAEAIGIDIDEQPVVESSPIPETEELFRTLDNAPVYPDVVTVRHDDGDFYVTESDFHGTFDVQGNPVPANGVVDARTLDVVSDELAEDVVRVMQRHDTNELRTTEATDELKKIVKKKKGKPVDE